MKTLLAALALAFTATMGQAAVVAYTWEENGNIVSSWSGSLDLTGLTRFQTTNNAPDRSFIQASRTYFFSVEPDYYGYSGASVNVTQLGSNAYSFSGTRSGDSFGYLTDKRYIYLAQSFASGDVLAGGSTILGQTLSGIGITTPQTVTFSWSNDSITHYYGVRALAPVPLPAGFGLLLAGLGGLALARRRAKRS